MRFFLRLLPALVAGLRLGWGALAWGWAGCSVLVLLCWLPWFELTRPYLTFGLTVLVYALTLTGLGPAYFAGRTQSQAWQQVLLNLQKLAWTSARAVFKVLQPRVLFTFFAIFVVAPYALVYAVIPLFSVVGFVARSIPDLNGQVLFERGHQQLVVWNDKPVVLWPLVPGFYFVTYPAITALDSTWTATTHLTTAPGSHYRLTDLAAAQSQLLTEAAQARLDAAQQQAELTQQQVNLAAQEATRQRLGYDVLHFELDTTFFSLNTECSLRQLREPLDSTHYGLAKLSPAGTLRFTSNQLTPGSNEVFTLIVAQLKGPGTYLLQLPQAAADTSTMQLRRYPGGVGITYRSQPDEPPRVEITRFDRQQRLVEGTFAGQLYSPNGVAITLKRGAFSLRFAAYRPHRLSPR